MTSICCKRETSQRTEGATAILTDVNLNTGLRDRANTLRIGYGQIWLQTDCRKRKIHGSKNRRGNFSLTKACGIFLPAAGKTRSESWYRSLSHTFSILRDNNSRVKHLCERQDFMQARSEWTEIRSRGQLRTACLNMKENKTTNERKKVAIGIRLKDKKRAVSERNPRHP